MADNGRAPSGQALVASDGAATHLHPTGFDPSRIDFPLLLAVFRGGVRRGSEEATSFDWGERPSGKWEDELVEALYYHLNANTKWGEADYLDWNAVQAIVADAIAMETQRAETENTGSVAKP